MRGIRSGLICFTVLQAVLAGRVMLRLARSARGDVIPRSDLSDDSQHVSVVVPVLNEASRLSACLEGLIQQSCRVIEIIVVDGGSTDGTQDLVRQYAEADSRIRLVQADEAPADWNGKSWNLDIGSRGADLSSSWILCVDADVRVDPGVAASLVTYAHSTNVDVLSVATSQEVSDAGSGILHPSMLTTLVYRFGIPGHVYQEAGRVQVNGQCFLISRQALEDVGGFSIVASANAEDVALARELILAGYRVGFFETDGLATVRMYDDWRGVWEGWGRSLPVRDRASLSGWTGGIADVAAVQALPLLIIAITSLLRVGSIPRAFVMLNVGLAFARLGVLIGTRRAYVDPPWTYWLSPLADIPVTLNLVINSVRTKHIWRGRRLMIEV